uniref:Uncharacterized protein n=1 Tax=Romanomermis culicivorax TaxID=13658 RepID=A0A915IVW5_ROMCU
MTEINTYCDSQYEARLETFQGAKSRDTSRCLARTPGIKTNKLLLLLLLLANTLVDAEGSEQLDDESCCC